MKTNIKWIVGKKYLVKDMTSWKESILQGFIINQIPVNWKNQYSYQNKRDNSIYFVLSFESNGKNHFVLALPQLNSRIYANIKEASSEIILQGYEYGDSIQQLIRKLQQNYVFTKKLCYDAVYKEGFKQQ